MLGGYRRACGCRLGRGRVSGNEGRPRCTSEAVAREKGSGVVMVVGEEQQDYSDGRRWGREGRGGAVGEGAGV
ncbi:unnamed protein product [Dovyalis caffra]|uniref:Uncharacterized protein n=1 Tax=Dovyalis caffra TaxID=77055 RepID=A0AAV1SSA6_9ROSI|nr:unnamed protein product [Dovyalis caffra]